MRNSSPCLDPKSFKYSWSFVLFVLYVVFSFVIIIFYVVVDAVISCHQVAAIFCSSMENLTYYNVIRSRNKFARRLFVLWSQMPGSYWSELYSAVGASVHAFYSRWEYKVRRFWKWKRCWFLIGCCSGQASTKWCVTRGDTYASLKNYVFYDWRVIIY